MAQLEDTTPTAEEIAALAKEGYSAAEVAQMTPDEREALMDTSDPTPGSEVTEPQAVDPNAPEKVEDEDEPDGKGMPDRPKSTKMPTDEVQDVDPPETEPKPVAAKPAAPAPAPAEVEETTDVDPASQVTIDPEPPRRNTVELEDKRDFAALRKTLSEKFGEGEITNEEYTEQLADIIKGETKREMYAEQAIDRAKQRWVDQTTDFLDANPAYQPQNRARYAALNETIKDLAKDPANAGKSGRWHLLEAKRLVELELGAPAGAKTPEPVVPATTKAAARAKPDLKSVPTTLAHVPAASVEDMSAKSEFERIDELEGLDQERALAKLSPARLLEYQKGDWAA